MRSAKFSKVRTRETEILSVEKFLKKQSAKNSKNAKLKFFELSKMRSGNFYPSRKFQKSKAKIFVYRKSFENAKRQKIRKMRCKKFQKVLIKKTPFFWISQIQLDVCIVYIFAALYIPVHSRIFLGMVWRRVEKIVWALDS